MATAFSGIGAPEQALRKLKIPHNILFAGDIDIFCKQSYFANYPISEDRWHNDVKEFDATPYKNLVDLFIGGSPCQSFSVMGKRKGLDEARGTLFYEYARIISETKPKVFVFENVTGLLNHDHGKTWDVVSRIFDDLDYSWTYWKLNAKHFGLPQNRERLFAVGFRRDLEPYFALLKTPKKEELNVFVESFLEKDIPNKYYLPEKGFVRVIDPAQSKHVVLNSKISRCQVACQQYNWFGDMRFESFVTPELEKDTRVFKGYYNGERGVARTLTPRECLRLMGFPDDFKIVVNDTRMYRQSGNSMAVNVVEAVLRSIMETGVFDGKDAD